MVILSPVCNRNIAASFAMNLVHSMIENCEVFQTLLDDICDCGDCNICVVLDILFYRKSNDAAFEKFLSILPGCIDPEYYPHEIFMFLLTTLRLSEHTNYTLVKSKEKCDRCDNPFEIDGEDTEQILKLIADDTITRCHVTELMARYFKGEVLCDHCGKRSSQFKKIKEIKNYLLIEIQRFGSNAEVMVPTTLSMKTSLMWYHLTLCGVACAPKPDSDDSSGALTSYTYDQLGRWCFVDGDEFEVVDDLTSSFDVRQNIGQHGRFFVYALAAQEDAPNPEEAEAETQSADVPKKRGRKPKKFKWRPKRRGPKPGEDLPGVTPGKTNLAKPFRAAMKPGLLCDLCGKKLVDKDGLRRHKMRIHSENRQQPKPRRRPIRPRRQGPRPGSVVAMQVLRMRAEGRVQACPVCQFNLGSRVLLMLHLESAHQLRAIVTKRFKTVDECEQWRRRLAEECCDVDVDVVAPILLEPSVVGQLVAAREARAEGSGGQAAQIIHVTEARRLLDEEERAAVAAQGERETGDAEKAAEGPVEVGERQEVVETEGKEVEVSAEPVAMTTTEPVALGTEEIVEPVPLGTSETTERVAMETTELGALQTEETVEPVAMETTEPVTLETEETVEPPVAMEAEVQEETDLRGKSVPEVAEGSL